MALHTHWSSLLHFPLFNNSPQLLQSSELAPGMDDLIDLTLDSDGEVPVKPKGCTYYECSVVFVGLYVYMCSCTVWLCVCVCMHMCMCACICACVHACVHMCMCCVYVKKFMCSLYKVKVKDDTNISKMSSSCQCFLVSVHPYQKPSPHQHPHGWQHW